MKCDLCGATAIMWGETHCYRCGTNLVPETARPDGAAFASTDLLGDLEAVHVRLNELRERARAQMEPQSRDDLYTAWILIEDALKRERRRSPSARLTD